MVALSLCQRLCPDKIPINLGAKVGEGMDGEVYLIKDNNKQVLKLSVIVGYFDTCLPEEYYNIKVVLDYLKDNNPSTYPHVYAHEKLFHSQDYLLFSCLMEKCFPLSDDEKKVFHSILSHEDMGFYKNYSELKIKEMLSGMSRGLDFDSERVIFFYQQYRSTPIRHHDLHVRNIMKDELGNFKLIDFDRTQLEIIL